MKGSSCENFNTNDTDLAESERTWTHIDDQTLATFQWRFFFLHIEVLLDFGCLFFSTFLHKLISIDE